MNGPLSFCKKAEPIINHVAGTDSPFLVDTPDPTFTRFLDLPPEHRENVYEHYLALEYEYRGSDFYANKRAHNVNWPSLHISKDT
jgi:hypothetical protein